MKASLKKYFVALAITLAALFVAYAIPYSYLIDVGGSSDAPFIAGFQAGENLTEFDYRWSSDDSTLVFPGVAQNENYQLVLRMAAGPRPDSADDPDLTISVNGNLLQTVAVDPNLKLYTFMLPASPFSSPDTQIDLKVPTFNPSRDISGSTDNRNLGVIADWARLQPAQTGVGRINFPHPFYILGWLASGGLVLATLLRTRLAQRRRSLWLAYLTSNGVMIGALVFARAFASLYVWYIAGALAIVAVSAREVPGWTAKARGRQPFTLDFIHTLGIANTRARGLIEFVLVAGLAAWFFATALWPLRTHSLPDFVSYYIGGALWLQGENYYDPNIFEQFNSSHALVNGVPPFLYPPIAAMFFAPLALLPIADAKLVWLLMNAAFLTGGSALLVASLRRAASTAASPVFLALMIVTSLPLRNSLGEGQVGPLIYFLLTLTMWASSKGNVGLASLSVVVGMALKIFPGLFLAYFLFKKNWRAVIIGTLFGFLLLALSLLNGGISAWLAFFSSVLPAISAGLPNFDNQAPAGFLSRLGAPAALLRNYDLLNQPEQTGLRLATIALSIALLAFTAWRIHKNDRADKLRTSIESAAVIALMLLVVPLVWEHYLMWLIIPLFVILNALVNSALTALAQVSLIAAGAVSWLFLQYGGPVLYDLPNWPIPLMSLGLAATVIIYASALYLLTQRGGELANGETRAV